MSWRKKVRQNTKIAKKTGRAYTKAVSKLASDFWLLRHDLSRKGVVKNIIIGVEITEPEIPYIFMHIFTVPILETICKTGGSRIDNFFFLNGQIQVMVIKLILAQEIKECLIFVMAFHVAITLSHTFKS